MTLNLKHRQWPADFKKPLLGGGSWNWDTSVGIRMLIQNKIKLGWIICSLGDYLVANRCFKCSKFNHRQRECRGTVTCPHCAGNHTLEDCSASPQHYKCINCHTFNMHHKEDKVSIDHSALDRNCPSLQAVLDKYRKNTDYWNGDQHYDQYTH